MNEFESQMVIAEVPDGILARHRIDRDDLEVVLGGPETYIKWFILFTPLLWLSGLLMPTAIILLLGLLWRIPPRKYLTDWLVLSWWLVSFAQAAAIFFNWVDSPASVGSMLRQIFSFPNSGWFFMGAALAVGKYSRLDSKQLARFASILGLYFIIFGIIAFFIYKKVGVPGKYIAMPFGYLIPENFSDLHRFFFTIRFYGFEYFFERSDVPRLVLWYPWAGALSLAGVGLLFMTIHEKTKFWKYLGVTGALVGILGSMGRMGAIAVVLSLMVYFWVCFWAKLRPSAKWATMLIFSTILLFLFSLNLGSGVVDKTMQKIEASREGSTDARRMVYEETWAAIHKSPVIGYGFREILISEEIPMPLGSHSTILGVLYNGGAVTFAAFCLAVIVTLFSLLRSLATSSNRKHLSAFCIFLVLLMFAISDEINYLFISNLIILFWMGMALAPLSDDEQASPKVLLL